MYSESNGSFCGSGYTMARFVALATRWLVLWLWLHDGSLCSSGYTVAPFCDSGLLRRLLMRSQRLNAVAYNVESSDLAVRVSILAG